MGETAEGTCKVRSGTDNPCLRQAAVEIGGVAFCERCAREQETYFALGELTQELATNRTEKPRGFRRNEPLVGRLLEKLRGLRRPERTVRAAEKEGAQVSSL